MKPKLCKDCIWSRKVSYELRCFNPEVTAKDAWALGSEREGGEFGKSCTTERGIKWFSECGMKGKLYE